METHNQYKINTNSDASLSSVSENVTGDERLFALFAHLSIFFGSIWIPLIFWVIFREKSRFVSFHSLQSLFFQAAYIVVMVLLVVFVAIVGLLTGLFDKKGGKPVNPDVFQIIVMLALGVIVIGVIFGSIIFAVYLAVKAYKGGLNKYPVIGNIIYKKIYGIN